MPCGLEDDRVRFEPDNLKRARAVEEHADKIMDECRKLDNAEFFNTAYDLYDGDLLPQLMQAIANWSGSSIVGPCNSDEQMRALHNLLANALHDIAERGVA
jgi:hypothetical protein